MKSASIKLKNIDVVFPVYNTSSLSLKDRTPLSMINDFIDLPFCIYSTVIRLKILIMDERLLINYEEFGERANQCISEIFDVSEIIILASHLRELIFNVSSG